MVSYMETALRGLDYGLGPNKRCTQNRSRVCHRSPIGNEHAKGGAGPHHSSLILSVLRAGVALPLGAQSTQTPSGCTHAERGMKSDPSHRGCTASKQGSNLSHVPVLYNP